MEAEKKIFTVRIVSTEYIDVTVEAYSDAEAQALVDDNSLYWEMNDWTSDDCAEACVTEFDLNDQNLDDDLKVERYYEASHEWIYIGELRGKKRFNYRLNIDERLGNYRQIWARNMDDAAEFAAARNEGTFYDLTEN